MPIYIIIIAKRKPQLILVTKYLYLLVMHCNYVYPRDYLLLTLNYLIKG